MSCSVRRASVGFPLGLRFRTLLDIPDNRLPTLMDVDMLDGDLLLSLASMAVKRLDLGDEGPRQLV